MAYELGPVWEQLNSLRERVKGTEAQVAGLVAHLDKIESRFERFTEKVNGRLGALVKLGYALLGGLILDLFLRIVTLSTGQGG